MGFKIPNFYKQTFQAPNSKGPAPSTHSKQSPLNVTPPNGSSSDKPKRSFDEAYEKRDQDIYGSMSKEEYIKEAKRQKKSKEDGKGYDAPSKPITKAKVETDKPVETKPVETKPVETKSEETKNEEPKNRRQKRSDRIKKREEKKKEIKKIKESGLKGKEKREAKRAVREKVGKTKVGKFLKSAKDKVVGDALGNEVKKDSPAAKLTSIERRAARKQGKAARAQNDADYGKKERKSIDENPAPTGKKKERLQKKADRKQRKADKLKKKADISIESLSKMSDEKRNAIINKAKKHKNKNR